MGLFGKKPQKAPPFIPETYLRGLRDFGEFLAGESHSYNADLIADLTMLNFAHDDPAAYLSRLAAAIPNGPQHISGYAGPCCLGAAEVAPDMMSIEPPAGPAWGYIVDTATAYLRENGIPYARIKPFMREWWEESHSPGEW